MLARLRTFALAALVVGIVSPAGLISGQQSSPSAGDLSSKRSRVRHEDEVARLFEETRVAAHRRPLTRTGRLRPLEQLVCTAALRDKPAWQQNSPARLMYRTADPGQLTTELKQIAEYEDISGDNAPDRVMRYAVAAWPTVDKMTGQPAFWVGVQLRPKAWIEFVDQNLTDDRPYRNDWKASVAPECRSVR